MCKRSLSNSPNSQSMPSMVANPRARMNKFVMGVSILIEKECGKAILLNNMDICRLMVYAQQIEKSEIKKIRKEGKRLRSNDSSHQNPKKRFYHQDSSMGNKDKSQNRNS